MRCPNWCFGLLIAQSANRLLDIIRRTVRRWACLASVCMAIDTAVSSPMYVLNFSFGLSVIE